MAGPASISLPSCARPGYIMQIPKCDRCLVDADNGHLPTSGLENSSFCNSKTNDSARNVIFCHQSSSACSVTRTEMTRSSKLNTNQESRDRRRLHNCSIGRGSPQLKCTQRKLPDLTAHLLKVKTKPILTPKTTTKGEERGGSKREHSCLVLICLETLFGYRI